MATKCTRSMTCRCPDCTAAMEMFSAKDLIAVASSKVDFTEPDDQGAAVVEKAAVVEPIKVEEKPKPSERKRAIPSLAERRQMMKEKFSVQAKLQNNDDDVIVKVAPSGFGDKAAKDDEVLVIAPPIPKSTSPVVEIVTQAVSAKEEVVQTFSAKVEADNKNSDDLVSFGQSTAIATTTITKEVKSSDFRRERLVVKEVDVQAVENGTAAANDAATTTAVRRRRTGPRSSKLPFMNEQHQSVLEESFSSGGEKDSESLVMETPAQKRSQDSAELQQQEPALINRVAAVVSVARSSITSLFGKTVERRGSMDEDRPAVSEGDDGTNESRPPLPSGIIRRTSSMESASSRKSSLAASDTLPKFEQQPLMPATTTTSVPKSAEVEEIVTTVKAAALKASYAPVEEEEKEKPISSKSSSTVAVKATASKLPVEEEEEEQERPSSKSTSWQKKRVVEEPEERPLQMNNVKLTTGGMPPMDEIGGDGNEIDYSSMPLDQRLASSDWKARKSAYEELAQKASSPEGAASFSSQLSLLEAALSNEANASALDAVLEACLAHVKNGPADLAEDETSRASRWIPAMGKRCFTGRPSTRQRANDLVLEMFAVDSPKAVASALVSEIPNKNAKIPVACIACLRDACIQFGAGKVVPPSAIIQAVEQGMAATPPAIRAESVSLAVEAIGWLGEGFKGVLQTKLATDAQKKELDRKLKEESEKPNYTAEKRSLRQRRDDTSESDGGGKAGGAGTSKGASMGPTSGNEDMFEFLTAHDVLSKLEKPIDLEKRLKAPKWSERKDVLMEVETACGKPPKLVAGDYGPLVSMLKKVVVNDSHQQVVIQALMVLLALSEGLRSSFTPQARGTMSVLLEKLKDQKKPITSAVDQVLDSFAKWSVNIGEERMTTLIADAVANPKATPLQVKHIMNFIERFARDGPLAHWQQTTKFDIEPLRQVVKTKMAHADPSVRQAASAAMELLKSATSTSAVTVTTATASGATTSVMPPATKSSLDQNHAASSINQKKSALPTSAKAAATEQQQQQPSSSSSRSNLAVRRDSATSVSSVPASGGVPQVAYPGSAGVTTKSRIPAPPSVTNRSASAVSGQRVTTTPGLSSVAPPSAPSKAAPASAMDEMLELLCRSSAPLRQAVQAELVSPRWEERASMLQTFYHAIRSFPIVDEWQPAQLDAIAQIAGVRTRDFADANPGVMMPAWDVVRFCAQKATGPCEYLETIVLSCAASKLSDKKQNPPASDFLTELASGFNGPAWVMVRLLRCSRAAGGPKTKQAIYDWMAECTQQFGLDQLAFDPKECSFEDFIRTLCSEEGVGNVSLDVRGSALSVLGEICKQMGASRFAKIAVIPPSISQECQRRVGGANVLPPNRTWRFAPNLLLTHHHQVGATSLVPEEEGKPQDLSSEIEPLLAILNTSDAPSWKKREDALVQLERTLNSTKMVIVNRAVRELATALGKRLDDTQRNVAARAAACLGMLCESVGGNGSASLVKSFGERLLVGLGDSKKNVASACQTALTLCVCHQGMIHSSALLTITVIITELFKAGTKCDRAKILQWLCERMEERWEQQEMGGGDMITLDAPTKQAYLDLIPTLVLSFTAKELMARKSAMKIAELIAASFPEQLAATRFRASIRDLKPAEQRIVGPTVEEVLTLGNLARRRREEIAAAGGGARRQDAEVAANAGPMTPPEPAVVVVEHVEQQMPQLGEYNIVQRGGHGGGGGGGPLKSEHAKAAVQQQSIRPSAAPQIATVLQQEEEHYLASNKNAFQPPQQRQIQATTNPNTMVTANNMIEPVRKSASTVPAAAAVNPVGPMSPPPNPRQVSHEEFFTPVQSHRPASASPETPKSDPPVKSSWYVMPSTTMASLVEVWDADSSTCREMLREEIFSTYPPNLAEALYASNRKNLHIAMDLVGAHQALLAENPLPFLLWATTILRDESSATPLFRALLDNLKRIVSSSTVQLNSYEAEAFVRYVIRRFGDDSLSTALKEKLGGLLSEIPRIHPPERYLGMLIRYVASTVIDQRVREASLLVASKVVRDSEGGFVAAEQLFKDIVPLVQAGLRGNSTTFRAASERFVECCEAAATPLGKLALVREWFSTSTLRSPPKTPPSPQRAGLQPPSSLVKSGAQQQYLSALHQSHQNSDSHVAEISDEARDLLTMIDDVRAVATLLDESVSVSSSVASPGEKRENVVFIRAQKTCAILTKQLLESTDLKWERMVEDTMDASYVLSICSVVIERLAMRRPSSSMIAGADQWRKGSLTVQLCRAVIDLASAVLSRRTLRFQCDETCVRSFVLSLLVLHARIRSLRDGPMVEKKLCENVESAFFGPLCLTPGWLHVVLSLDPAPVEFVRNGLQFYASRLAEEDEEAMDSLNGETNLAECVKLARRTTWVPFELIRVLEMFVPSTEPAHSHSNEFVDDEVDHTKNAQQQQHHHQSASPFKRGLEEDEADVQQQYPESPFRKGLEEDYEDEYRPVEEFQQHQLTEDHYQEYRQDGVDSQQVQQQQFDVEEVQDVHPGSDDVAGEEDHQAHQEYFVEDEEPAGEKHVNNYIHENGEEEAQQRIQEQMGNDDDQRINVEEEEHVDQEQQQHASTLEENPNDDNDQYHQQKDQKVDETEDEQQQHEEQEEEEEGSIRLSPDEQRLADVTLRIMNARESGTPEQETLAAVNDLVELKRRSNELFDFDVSLLFQGESPLFLQYLTDKMKDASYPQAGSSFSSSSYNIDANMDRLMRIAKVIEQARAKTS